MRKAFALLCLCLPVALFAQSVNIEPGQCVWHAGDNLAWAAPNLDESGWQRTRSRSETLTSRTTGSVATRT